MRMKESTTNKIMMAILVICTLTYIILMFPYLSDPITLMTIGNLVVAVIILFAITNEDGTFKDLMEWKQKINEKMGY